MPRFFGSFMKRSQNLAPSVFSIQRPSNGTVRKHGKARNRVATSLRYAISQRGRAIALGNAPAETVRGFAQVKVRDLDKVASSSASPRGRLQHRPSA